MKRRKKRWELLVARRRKLIGMTQELDSVGIDIAIRLLVEVQSEIHDIEQNAKRYRRAKERRQAALRPVKTIFD
jgi:hypothetical protein